MRLVLPSLAKGVIRSALPSAVVNFHDQRRTLRALGFDPEVLHNPFRVTALYGAVISCGFELWPDALRHPPYEYSVVDVGANIGVFTRAVLTLMTPTALVAFEPQRHLAGTVTAAMGSFPSGRVVSAAVSDRPGESTFNETRDSWSSSLLAPAPEIRDLYQAGNLDVVVRTTVPVVTLDQELASLERIGILKIDVEGSELSVLDGARETLRRTDAVLIETRYVEHHLGGAMFDDVYQHLHHAGFRLHAVSAPLMSGNAQGPPTPLWADSIFVRRDPRQAINGGLGP